MRGTYQGTTFEEKDVEFVLGEGKAFLFEQFICFRMEEKTEGSSSQENCLAISISSSFSHPLLGNNFSIKNKSSNITKWQKYGKNKHQ